MSGRLRTRNPPPVVGEVTIKLYDRELWQLIQETAETRGVEPGLIVHSALKNYARQIKALTRWIEMRREHDARDPELRAIAEFLRESGA